MITREELHKLSKEELIDIILQSPQVTPRIPDHKIFGIVKLKLMGKTHREIAQQMNVSTSTVSKYLKPIDFSETFPEQTGKFCAICGLEFIILHDFPEGPEEDPDLFYEFKEERFEYWGQKRRYPRKIISFLLERDTEFLDDDESKPCHESCYHFWREFHGK